MLLTAITDFEEQGRTNPVYAGLYAGLYAARVYAGLD